MHWLVAMLVAWATARGPEFPRIATYLIESHIDETARATIASSDVAIVDVEAAAHDRASLDVLRIERPSLTLLAYLTSEEVPREPADERPLANARFSRIPPAAWLVDPGSTLLETIDESATMLRVADGSAFTLARPRSDFYPDGEPTYLLVDGEHMKLVAIEGDTLIVERGFRSPAVAHPAKARVASHVVFFGGTWMLNLTSAEWRTLLADEAASLVAAGPWNGVFLDVCFEDISWLNGGVVDLDRDGVADGAAASRRWSAGMGELVDTLRARLGPDVPIVSNPGAQNCPHPALDGILMEGWPVGMPTSYLGFEEGQARYETWSRRPLTIANAFSPKIGFGTIARGADERARTDFAAMRFGLGVTLMHDGLYAYDNGVFGHYVSWWYDEYDGAGRGRHWLGHARGPVRSKGTLRWRVFDRGLAVVNVGDVPASFRVPPGYRKLAGTQDPVHNDGAPVTGMLAVPPRDAYLLTN